MMGDERNDGARYARGALLVGASFPLIIGRGLAAAR